jgi:ribosome biogenesis GTPase A
MRVDERSGATGGRLAVLAGLANEAGAEGVARDAEALAARLRERRFYVACVGQFKRGKSTLINALVGAPVLPTGIVPITAAVTVVRHGDRLSARIRCGGRDWESCDPRGLATFVSEEHNPGNEKDVTAVEVFVPSPLLESGMCLVDTPGIGSVSTANSAATRAFVPHIDAALVVLGADPPITGEELTLVSEIAQQVRDLIFVLNKADRLPANQRREAARFIERVLAERLGYPIGSLLEVSAVERLAGAGIARDWDGLVERLATLAQRSGAELVRTAEDRGTNELMARLLADLDEQRDALLRPIQESEVRVEALRRTIGDAERALEELGHRLTAVQERLSSLFTEERDRAFKWALPEAQQELVAAIRGELAMDSTLRRRAIDLAMEVARRWLDRWREAEEPRVEALYREATRRFAQLVDEVQHELAAVPGLQGFSPTSLETGLVAKSRLHYTEMLTVAPASAGARLLDALRTQGSRIRAVEGDATRYLERLLEVNSARIKNDFRERVIESRRGLELEIRQLLHGLTLTAERALDQARRAQATGTAAVQARLAVLSRLRAEVEALRRPEA